MIRILDSLENLKTNLRINRIDPQKVALVFQYNKRDLPNVDSVEAMPAEAQGKAFEAFFTTKHRGTGLGLPIARRVVESHGGRIHIEVPPSGGTIFTVVLSAAR